MPHIEVRDGKKVFRCGVPLVAAFMLIFLVAGLYFQISVLLAIFFPGSVDFQIDGKPIEEAPAGQVVFSALFPSLFWGFALIAILYALVARYELDDEALSYVNLLGFRTKHLPWKEAERVEISSRRTTLVAFTILGAGSNSIKVKRCPGWPIIRAEVSRRLPHLFPPTKQTPTMRPPNRVIPAQGRFFRPSMALIYVPFGVVWTILVVSFMLGVLYTGGPPTMLIFGGMFLCIGLWLILHGLRSGLRVADNGITAIDFLGREDEIPWSEVEGFEFESISSGETTTRFYCLRSSNRYLQINGDISRWNELVDIICSRISDSAIIDLDDK